MKRKYTNEQTERVNIQKIIKDTKLNKGKIFMIELKSGPRLAHKAGTQFP